MSKKSEKTRLEKLKDLEKDLYGLMQRANSRSIPSLARQYRETLAEIDLLEGGEGDGDEIASIILRHRKPAADE